MFPDLTSIHETVFSLAASSEVTHFSPIIDPLFTHLRTHTSSMKTQITGGEEEDVQELYVSDVRRNEDLRRNG